MSEGTIACILVAGSAALGIAIVILTLIIRASQ